MVLRKKEIVFYIFVIFAIFSLAPDIVDVNGHTYKIMYVIFAVLFLITLGYKKFKLPNKVLLTCYVYFLLVSLANAIKWGIDRLFFNYCFGFCVITLCLTFGKDFILDDWLKIFRIVWIALVILIAINDFSQLFRFIEYRKYGLDHPYIGTVVTGGVNLEATWVAILVLAFFNLKKRWIPFFLSLAISLLYASRVGIVANMIVLFIFVFERKAIDSNHEVMRRRLILSSVALVMVVVLFKRGSEQMLSVFKRFTQIGREAGSLGRIAMWRYIPKLIFKYPLGVGLGNSMLALKKVSPLNYVENNLHNLFLQMFVEVGIVGGIIYLLLWFYFLKNNLKKIFTNPIVGMLIAYFVLSLIQFRGGETIFFCILGAYLAQDTNLNVENSIVRGEC